MVIFKLLDLLALYFTLLLVCSFIYQIHFHCCVYQYFLCFWSREWEIRHLLKYILIFLFLITPRSKCKLKTLLNITILIAFGILKFTVEIIWLTSSTFYRSAYRNTVLYILMISKSSFKLLLISPTQTALF